MKKCFFSMYTSVVPAELCIIKHDLCLFNQMERTAFSCVKNLGGDKPLEDGTSIHMYLKETFHVSDYFANSARQEAKAIFKSAMERLSSCKDDLDSRIKQMEKKIKRTNSRLKHLEDEKLSLIKRSKTGKGKFKSYKGGRESEKDGVFYVRRGKHKDIYENAYLFEVQYLNSEIKKLKSRIRFIAQRKTSCECKLEKLKKVIENHTPSVCFGSRKFFKKQNTVYQNHEDWKHTYHKRRSYGMTISGRKDASQGNFVFRYDEKSHTLTYKSMSGKEVILTHVTFPYGQEFVDHAISAIGDDRHAVAWRLELHGNRILVKCMVELPETKKNESFETGCIAFDSNVDHLAIADVDKNGNLLSHKVIAFNLNGKTTEQRKQILSAVLEEVFQFAQERKKPIAMEHLKDIKNNSMYQDKQLNRKLSGFSYHMIAELSESKSYKYGISLWKVHPAYTSQIGKIKYMRHYGLSIHEAAALVIGRRAIGYKEILPKSMRHLLTGEKINRHQWAHWRFFALHLKEIKYQNFYNYIHYEKIETIKELKQTLNTI